MRLNKIIGDFFALISDKERLLCFFLLYRKNRKYFIQFESVIVYSLTQVHCWFCMRDIL